MREAAQTKMQFTCTCTCDRMRMRIGNEISSAPRDLPALNIQSRVWHSQSRRSFDLFPSVRHHSALTLSPFTLRPCSWITMEDEVAALVRTIIYRHGHRLISIPLRLLITVLECAKLAVSWISLDQCSSVTDICIIVAGKNIPTAPEAP
jgi:hypothetical protein